MAKKKPLTCPVCKKKFYHSAKSHPMKRLSKHLWSSHKSYMLRKQKSGKRKKSKAQQLDEELQLADDIMLAVILEIDERLENLEGRPTIHRDAVGMLIDRIKKEAGHSMRGEVPKKPIKKALLGNLYKDGYKKRGE